eukprot:gnl/Chilomastix_cuspidata/3466.p3 GENE.gnl/Chilomastix_cuspidata/3466~~gnl/Chilomastix_cuspidata/3466.p3  ORF type:complete len:139 (+),score=52.05 gnl/Chilomastix_cuspidata/3466:710-1126(+)
MNGCIVSIKRRNETAASRRGRWTPREDELLIWAVSQCGVGNWVEVARLVPHRNDQQCLRHWEKVLNPAIRKGRFTSDEDKALLEAVSMLGTGRWSAVAKYVPGRTDKQVHLRYNTIKGNRKKKPLRAPPRTARCKGTQ